MGLQLHQRYNVDLLKQELFQAYRAILILFLQRSQRQSLISRAASEFGNANEAFDRCCKARALRQSKHLVQRSDRAIDCLWLQLIQS